MFICLLQAYISCALGVHRVGYVMICFGVVNAICSLLFGSIMKYVGRQPLMALGALVHAALIGVLLIWRPHPDRSHIFYMVSGLWGVGDAVWQTQVNGSCPLFFFPEIYRRTRLAILKKSLARSEKRKWSWERWRHRSHHLCVATRRKSHVAHVVYELPIEVAIYALWFFTTYPPPPVVAEKTRLRNRIHLYRWWLFSCLPSYDTSFSLLPLPRRDFSTFVGARFENIGANLFSLNEFWSLTRSFRWTIILNPL